MHTLLSHCMHFKCIYRNMAFEGNENTCKFLNIFNYKNNIVQFSINILIIIYKYITVIEDIHI